MEECKLSYYPLMLSALLMKLIYLRTYADLAFIPWNKILESGSALPVEITEKNGLREKYPNFFAWHERLVSRPAVKKALGIE